MISCSLALIKLPHKNHTAEVLKKKKMDLGGAREGEERRGAGEGEEMSA